MRINKFRQINQNLSRGEVFTHPKLVAKIISKIPESVYLNKESMFLVPGCGMGVFMIELVRVLVEQYGYTIEDAKSRVIGIDNRIKYINYLKRKGYRVYHLDFLKDELPMIEFDAIVGNPPYQESDNTSTYTNLWSKFVLKSYQLLSKDGHMVMVTPKTWATPKDEKRKTDNNLVSKLIQEKSNFINLDECGKYFSVGSTFSYYHITKSTPNDKIELMTNTFHGNVDRKDLLFIKDINYISLSILKKIKNKGFFKKEKNTSLVGNISNEKTDVHKYRVQYAFTTEKWSDTKHPLQDKLKIIFPNQNSKNYPIFDCGISAPANRGAVYLVENELQGNNFVNFCKSKLINFYISQQRFHHGLINTLVISNIPKIDLNKNYTDRDLYNEFDLTEEEIEYIQKYVG